MIDAAWKRILQELGDDYLRSEHAEMRARIMFSTGFYQGWLAALSLLDGKSKELRQDLRGVAKDVKATVEELKQHVH